MANRAYIVTPKLSDLATLTANNAVGGAGATNLQHARPRLRWRSTTSSPYLVGDFGAAKAIDTLVLGFINGGSGDTFRLRMASTQAKLTDGSAEYDSRVGGVDQPMWPAGSSLSAYLKIHRAFLLAGAGVTLRWFQVDFDFSANPLGYVEMGRLLLGKRVEPSVSVKAGWIPSGGEPIAETVDMGGEESPRVMGVKRSLTATWHDLSQAEQDALYVTMLERGTAKDIALVLHPENTAYPMHQIAVGRVKSESAFPQTYKRDPEATGLHYTYSLTVSEMAPVEMV